MLNKQNTFLKKALEKLVELKDQKRLNIYIILFLPNFGKHLKIIFN